MELEAAIRGRRSIRRYTSEPVSEDLIMDILDLARHAPSSMNGQPCSFIVVRDRKLRERLAELKDTYCSPGKTQYRANMLREAQVVIVICVNLAGAHDRVLENGALAAANLLLAAQGRGLGSVYMTAYRDDEPRLVADLCQLLEIPATETPVVILPLGYPDEIPGPKTLKPLSGLVHHDRFHSP